MLIKKIRITLTYFISIYIFIAVQSEKEVCIATFFEGLGIAGIIFGLSYALFSDWMYYEELIGKGLKIKYLTFQKIGLGSTFWAIFIVVHSPLDTWLNVHINALHYFTIPLIIFVLVELLSSQYLQNLFDKD